MGSTFKMVGVFALVVTVASSSLLAQVGKMYPADEAARDPEFFAFRARLLIALQQKDVDFLYSIVAADILNSFGGDGGLDEFKTTWRPEEPTSRLWATLTEILALGGQFQQPDPAAGYGSKMFAAPYVFAVTPGGGFDPFEHGVVIGSGVRVRQQPSPTSSVLASLTFDVVRVTDWRPRPDTHDSGARSWTAVQLADGRSGYVASEFIRSRIGYRAIFALREGRWLLRALVAGD